MSNSIIKAIKMPKNQWLRFVIWYEEVYNNCEWIPNSTWTAVKDMITGDIIAFITDIPLEYYAKSDFYESSPWGHSK
jgi:hypothetical protein